jgi:DNA-binding NarL/FixJ family response regulator
MGMENTYPALSPRQLQVVQLLANGLRVDRISGELDVKPTTIRLHIAKSREKWGAKTTAELVARGYQLGVLE